MSLPIPPYSNDVNEWLNKNEMRTLWMFDFMIIELIKSEVPSAAQLDDWNIQQMIMAWRQQRFGPNFQLPAFKPSPQNCSSEISISNNKITRKYKCDQFTLGSKSSLLGDQYISLLLSPEETAAIMPQKLDEASVSLKISKNSKIKLFLKPDGKGGPIEKDDKIGLSGDLTTDLFMFDDASIGFSATHKIGKDTPAFQLSIGNLKYMKGITGGFSGTIDPDHVLDKNVDWKVEATLKINLDVIFQPRGN